MSKEETGYMEITIALKSASEQTYFITDVLEVILKDYVAKTLEVVDDDSFEVCVLMGASDYRGFFEGHYSFSWPSVKITALEGVSMCKRAKILLLNDMERNLYKLVSKHSRDVRYGDLKHLKGE